MTKNSQRISATKSLILLVLLIVKNDTISDKAEARTISLPVSFWNQIEAKVGRNKGARSQYLQSLIKADLEGDMPLPQPLDSDAILKLAQAFAPTAYRNLSKWLSAKEFDQPHLIAQCLNTLADNVRLTQALTVEAERLGTTLPEVMRIAVVQYLHGEGAEIPFSPSHSPPQKSTAAAGSSGHTRAGRTGA